MDLYYSSSSKQDPATTYRDGRLGSTVEDLHNLSDLSDIYDTCGICDLSDLSARRTDKRLASSFRRRLARQAATTVIQEPTTPSIAKHLIM